MKKFDEFMFGESMSKKLFFHFQEDRLKLFFVFNYYVIGHGVIDHSIVQTNNFELGLFSIENRLVMRSP